MKPFDLEAAKRGEPICHSDGSLCKFVAYVPEAHKEQRVVILTAAHNICTWAVDRIFMAPRTVETKPFRLWVNADGNICCVQQNEGMEPARIEELGNFSYWIDHDWRTIKTEV